MKHLMQLLQVQPLSLHHSMLHTPEPICCCAAYIYVQVEAWDRVLVAGAGAAAGSTAWSTQLTCVVFLLFCACAG